MRASLIDLRFGHAPLVLAFMAAALWSVPLQLFELWMDADRGYSHGLLVAPIAAWLVWRVSRERAMVPARSSWIGLALLGIVAFGWLLGVVGEVLVVQQVLFPVLLSLAIAGVFGWRAARELSFPLGLLFYAMPIWNYLVPVLQSLTVATVRAALDSIAIPVHAEGNLISIPEGTFEIAGGCAGLHYFVVALVISSLYAYLGTSQMPRRIAVVAIGASMAMVTNWVRVASLVVIGHATDMQHYLIAEDHYYYGWVLFAIGLIPFFLVARRIAIDDANGTVAQAAEPAVERGQGSRAGVVWLMVVLIAVVAAAQWRSIPAETSSVTLVLPPGSGAWAGPEPGGVTWSPKFAGASGDVRGRYSSANGAVDVYAAVYLAQGQGRELIGESNRLSEGSQDWGSARLRVLSLLPARSVNQRIFQGVEGAARRVVWYWYVVGDAAVAAESEAKVRQAFRGLIGRSSGAAVVLSVPCPYECGEEQYTALEAFMAEMAARLETMAVAAQAAGS